MYPQQGYQQAYPQPYGAPVRLRANPVASVLAGLLAVLTAGLLVWFAAANIAAYDTPWPSVVRTNVIGGFFSAGLLVIAALFTFARKVAGAWTVFVISLLFAIMIVSTPLMRGDDLGAHFDFVFGFHKTTGVAIGLSTIACVLTAVVAVVAAVAKRPDIGGSARAAAWGQAHTR